MPMQQVFLGMGAKPVIASGGNETESGGYTYHEFTSSGTFTVEKSGTNIEYAIVAGGGSGGRTDSGGGGAGGCISSNWTPSSTGNVSVSIGAGAPQENSTWTLSLIHI